MEGKIGPYLKKSFDIKLEFATRKVTPRAVAGNGGDRQKRGEGPDLHVIHSLGKLKETKPTVPTVPFPAPTHRLSVKDHLINRFSRRIMI